MRLAAFAALLALAVPAGAQLVEPSPAHYAAAYDALAVELAAKRLEAADRRSRVIAAEIEVLRQLLRERSDRRSAILDAHALRVQRLAGERVAYLPGTGWHEVYPAGARRGTRTGAMRDAPGLTAGPGRPSP